MSLSLTHFDLRTSVAPRAHCTALDVSRAVVSPRQHRLAYYGAKGTYTAHTKHPENRARPLSQTRTKRGALAACRRASQLGSPQHLSVRRPLGRLGMSPRHHAPRAVGEAAGEHTVVEQRLGEGDGGVGGGEEEPRFACSRLAA